METRGIYDTLNEQQKKGVFTTDGPVLILAGAGSGKTSVLTHRTAYLIEQGVNPWNILAITFTNKAAGEMRERVDKIAGGGAQAVWVATFHSTCVRILRRFIDRLGYDNSFTIYDTDDSKSVMKDVCKRLSIDTKMLKERTILSEISHAKDNLMTPAEYQRNAFNDYTQQRIAAAYAEYQNTLNRNNALDFDDLIVKTVELFKSCPEVLENYQNRFQYIMVDEYQDTNTAQFELVRLLAAKNRNLCVVGDDDQSIYKFRGANIRNILDFEETYPEAVVIKLEQNYRSTQNILTAANAVIQNNSERKSKSLWTDKGDGNILHFREFDTAREEADYIAGDIKRKKRELIADYRDNAVLYRTNAQSRLLEESFVALSIPYTIVGGVNFYARREIKDVLAYLKTIDNARDDLAVKRIINVPRRGIGAASIEKVQSFADENGISFFSALQRTDEIPALGKSAEKLNKFALMIRGFRTKLEGYTLEDLVTDVLETTGYTKELEESNEEDADDRLANIDELVSKIVSYELEQEKKGEKAVLSEFLEEVALVADIDNVDKDSNRVLLMTIHSAKGLEFPNVYLSGMEEGVFPSYMTISSDDRSDLEEERRLAYVGITRAKDDLTLTYAKARMIKGKTQYNGISQFVSEIPAELFDSEPKRRKARLDEDDYGYDGGSYQKSIFNSKPYSDSPAERKNNWLAAGEYMKSGQTLAAPVKAKKDISQIMLSKPKAVVRKKETPEANKPYISRTLNSLTKGAAVVSTGELGYKAGDRVSHVKFGEGTVLNIEDTARDYRVTVDFDEYGNKIMYAAFAKLEKI